LNCPESSVLFSWFYIAFAKMPPIVFPQELKSTSGVLTYISKVESQYIKFQISYILNN